MKSTNTNQESARQTWEWLWEWVKTNKPEEYKGKYIISHLAARLRSTPGAVSSWKEGRMNFSESKYPEIIRILDEWCALLPADGWITPYHYSDEDKVQHILDYKGGPEGRRFVECDYFCLSCGKRTPSAGLCCMFCGKKFPHELD